MDPVMREVIMEERISRAEMFYETESLYSFLDREAENDLLSEVRFSLEAGKTPLFFCNELGSTSREAS